MPMHGLALFAGDAAFYLEQPVREDIRSAISACNADPLLVGPLPRETFERCLETLVRLMTSELGREELVGDGDGPYAPTFPASRDGPGQLAACSVSGRPSQLAAGKQLPGAAMAESTGMVAAGSVSVSVGCTTSGIFRFGRAGAMPSMCLFASPSLCGNPPKRFLDCLTGTGSMRRDPVQQLLSAHGTALADLNGALTSESDRYYAEVTRAAADIDLDGDASQLTAYRPEGLSVGPCPEAQACGVRAELPVESGAAGAISECLSARGPDPDGAAGYVLRRRTLG